MKHFIVLIFGLATGLATSTAALAEPYTPSSDNEVLQTLPRALIAEQNQVDALRQRLTAQPQDAATAATLAKQYLQLGNTSGDPRYWGYAQAVLQPWWDAPKPPASLLYLRAKLQEKQHAYLPAATDYKALLKRQPDNIQARLDLSNVYRVQGDYQQALQACAYLSKSPATQILDVCRNPVFAVTGQAEQAYQSLQAMLPWAQLRSPALVESNEVLMAEVAEALGRTEQARKHFSAALALAPDDLYLRRAYADFLLDQNEPQQALSLLRSHTQDNGMLLRAAIAAEASGEDSRQYVQELQQRFEEIRLRGDTPHRRYEARFELELKHNPNRALQLARENWAQQKEPRDTRNFLAAALAAQDKQAAKPVIEFLRRNQTQDTGLHALIKQIESLP